MKKVFITGSEGMLGSKLVEHHLQQEDFVISSDVLPCHYLTEHRKHIQEDIRNIDINTLPGEIDIVYHFAGLPCPSHYLDRPIETVELTVGTAKATLDLARRCNATYVLASSSEVYGDPKEIPQREEYTGSIETTHPRSVYSEAKRLCETLTMAHHHEYGLDTKIARIFNSYGKFLDGDTRIIPAFFKALTERTPIKIFGDGEQKRSYCFVDDTIEGILKLADSHCHSPINIGNYNEFYSVKEIANILMDATNMRVPIIYEENSNMIGAINRRPSIQKAKEILNWKPFTDFYTGISKIKGLYILK